MGKEEIEDMVAPQKRSLANTGIQLQDVVDEKVTTLSPMAGPGALLAGDLEWTRPYQQQRSHRP